MKPIPPGYHTVTPTLMVRDSLAAIEFYKQAFGAVALSRFPAPGGQGTIHAEIRIGDSMVMLGDELPGMACKSPTTLGETTVSLFLYVDDVDEVFRRAVAAGAKEVMAPCVMFWGDRFAKVIDPFGHSWSLATHMEDLPPEEIRRRGEAFFAQMAPPQK